MGVDGSGEAPSLRQCLVVTEHLSHYRVGVYRELDSSDGWSFTFAGADQVRDGSIPAIPRGSVQNQLQIRNYWVANRLLIQPRVVWLSLTRNYQSVIFVGNVAFVTTWVAALILRLRRIPVLFWTIGWSRPDKNRLKWAARRAFYGLADRLLLYGEDGFAFGLEAGVNPAKMLVIGNSFSFGGPSSSHNEKVPDLRTPDPQTRYVGAVVRLNPEKRFDMLIAAVAQLRAEGMDVAVLLTGSGPAEKELQEQAAQLSGPLVITGPLHDENHLRTVYSHLVVTVIPERAGLSVMQSMKFGTPVVTTDDPTVQVPEFRAVVPGKTGYLYRRGSVASLGAAIRRSLELVERDAAGVGDACRAEISRNWSVQAQARKILEGLNSTASVRDLRRTVRVRASE